MLSNVNRVRPALARVNKRREAGRSPVRQVGAAGAETGPDHARWNTLAVKRTVLFAVHTITSLMRLEDIVILLEDDPRVQLVYTEVPDQLGDGVGRRLQLLEVRVIPWAEAMQRDVDLVVSASLHRLEDIPAKTRFAAPHGAGYNKLWPAWAMSGAGGRRPVYGLDRASLLDDRGRPVVDALLLPHPDHLETLVRQCPEAEPCAVVAGDPCYDRLVVCMALREHYRALLGIRPAQVLVTVASTWGEHSLLRMHPDLLRRLSEELPANHRLIATVHPAVWSAHGARQVRTWLRDVRAAGVDLVDTGEDWRGLIAATDVLVADHSSVAAYAAGVRIPLLLSHFPDEEVDPNSIMAELATRSPRLHPEIPLLDQLDAARNAQPGQWQVANRRVAARKGMSAEMIRETLYRLLQLPEPAYQARWPQVPVPRLVRD